MSMSLLCAECALKDSRPDNIPQAYYMYQGTSLCGMHMFIKRHTKEITND